MLYQRHLDHDVLSNMLGAALVGVALSLTAHSYLRLRMLTTNGYNDKLLNIVNIFTLFHEFAVILLIYANEGLIEASVIAHINLLVHISYQISKSGMFYLVYKRTSLVCEQFRDRQYLHLAFICACMVSLAIFIFASVISDFQCFQGNVEKSQKCEILITLQKIERVLAPLWRFYYIIAESIFFFQLVKMLRRHVNLRRNVKMLRYTHFQTVLFFIDILQLVGMCVYRILPIIEQVTMYWYFECFSSAFTAYNMSQFGITVPKVFRENPNDGVIAPEPNQNVDEESSQRSRSYELSPTRLEQFALSNIGVYVRKEKFREVSPSANMNYFSYDGSVSNTIISSSSTVSGKKYLKSLSSREVSPSNSNTITTTTTTRSFYPKSTATSPISNFSTSNHNGGDGFDETPSRNLTPEGLDDFEK
ncbi:hypothetical protein G9A89_006525 [Geosiphon pyriformis]|nr:hypothetical protein G9A89_006525 [Geosiphon pyriformis]